MVLTHHGLHDHTRGINTSAYGEYLFSFHLASAVLRKRQHPARTELAILYQLSFIEASCPLVHYLFFLPCISYHHFLLLHQQPRTFFNNDFLSFFLFFRQPGDEAGLVYP